MSISNNRVLPAPPPAQADNAEFVEGFRRVEAEIRAVPDNELISINVDVPSAIASVLGTLPELNALRPQFAGLIGFDLTRVDKLRDYALALGHTHAMYRAAAGPSDGLSAMANELIELRDVLQADAMALAKRKVLDEAQVTKLRSGVGYKNIAFEVVGLIGLFRERWDSIKGRTLIQPEELEHAGRRAQELVTAVGLKEQAPAMVGAAAAVRQRAFTLFSSAYDEARRAVAYLRWHQNDADTIAPSLFAGRVRRGSDDTATDETAPNGTPVPVVPAATPAQAAAAPVGMPNSSPFAR
jgi:hypothetical protein